MISRRLRDRVTLKTRAVVNNGGVRTSTLEDVTPTRIPCQHESPSGQTTERVFGQQVRPMEAHIFTLRAFPAADLANVAIWHDGDGDRELEIVGRQQIGRDRGWLVLACKEVHA